MTATFSHKYEIGQRLYINLPESDPYLVTDVTYSKLYNSVEYELMNNMGTRDRYLEHELVTEKVIV